MKRLSRKIYFFLKIKRFSHSFSSFSFFPHKTKRNLAFQNPISPSVNIGSHKHKYSRCVSEKFSLVNGAIHIHGTLVKNYTTITQLNINNSPLTSVHTSQFHHLTWVERKLNNRRLLRTNCKRIQLR